MNVQQREVKTVYRLLSDDPQDLGALMVAALTFRRPVAVVATDEATGAVSRHEGVPVFVTADRVRLRTWDGGMFGCRRWEIDRAVVIDESMVAA
jgi:hypothetical protein